MKNKTQPPKKAKIHARSKHRERYDFTQLSTSCPELKAYIKLTVNNEESIDFFDANAVKMLNKALLKHHYAIQEWDIPDGYLCPPIPGRADYIHHIADVLSIKNFGNIPKGNQIKCVDIGVGANCIYPILGTQEYGWSFIGTDIDEQAIAAAQKTIDANENLASKIELRLQKDPRDTFFGVLAKNEKFDLSICNPPFHASQKEAQAVNIKKLSNLTHQRVNKEKLNFGGQSNELWCDGGEEKFIKNMIRESKFYGNSCFWFSTLVSKQSNLKNAYAALKKEDAVEVKTIPMGQGNKSTRIIAWTFLSPENQKEWVKSRWKK